MVITKAADPSSCWSLKLLIPQAADPQVPKHSTLLKSNCLQRYAYIINVRISVDIWVAEDEVEKVSLIRQIRWLCGV
ncbi:hypothetical protein D3C76_288910 [compost metagenome]